MIVVPLGGQCKTSWTIGLLFATLITMARATGTLRIVATPTPNAFACIAVVYGLADGLV